MQTTHSEQFDVIIVGGGHAGCEAALAAARMGRRTLLLTLSLDAIAQMSCNPSIGGQAKGQIVREIDALGGEMAKAIDRAGIHFRMLNTRKGPAVQAPRAQADKLRYQVGMKQVLEAQVNLYLRQDMVEDVLVEAGKVTGVCSRLGRRYQANAVVLTTGTFLRGLMHVGQVRSPGGRAGEGRSDGLSPRLAELGFEIGRLKTGTPPRVNGNSLNLDRCEQQPGDKPPRPFSFQSPGVDLPQVSCWLTWTGDATHQVIRDNLARSPLFSGEIDALGPRYCPSIEDKVVKFPHHERHQVFIEPEGLDTAECYVNGISTSMPPDVQIAMVHTIPGLETAQVTRFGYAVEYDFFPPTQLQPSLETRPVAGLFFAGQINGTTGYEEAAGQGIVAGINAALSSRGEPPLILRRDEAYIGVLIDDLVTQGTREPYRMFSSRAEYRLLLRHGNADRRLGHHGHRLGLLGEEAWTRVQEKQRLIDETLAWFEARPVLGSTIRRPEVHLGDLASAHPWLANLDPETREEAEVELKYAPYIARSLEDVERFHRLEDQPIPAGFDYQPITGLRGEAREKLSAIRPTSLGQASRISGVSPADLSIVMVHLRRQGITAGSPS